MPSKEEAPWVFSLSTKESLFILLKEKDIKQADKICSILEHETC